MRRHSPRCACLPSLFRYQTEALHYRVDACKQGERTSRKQQPNDTISRQETQGERRLADYSSTDGALVPAWSRSRKERFTHLLVAFFAHVFTGKGFQLAP